MKTGRAEINDDTTDKELIGLVADGNEPALNELMRRYKGKLYAFICRYVKDEDAAYDILQETFIRLYFKADSYKPSYKFSTWLYQIAINLCRDRARKQKLRRFLSLDGTNSANSNDDQVADYHNIIADPGCNIETLADTRQQLRILDREIEKLPHKLKTALILFVLEGHSQEKCAELLDVTIKTVETRIYRARKILAAKLAENF